MKPKNKLTHKRLHKDDFPDELYNAKPYEKFQIAGCKEFVNVYFFNEETESYRVMHINQIEGILKAYKKGLKKGYFQESCIKKVIH